MSFKGMLKALFGRGCAVAALSALVAVCVSGCENTYSVGEYKKQLEEKTNAELSRPDHPFRQRVERAHGTVDVTRAYVSSLEVETKDGSDNAGKDGENIRRVKMKITTNWDGWIHNGGYTELTVIADNVNGRLQTVDAKITDTNALIKDFNKFCFETGFLIGFFLL